MSQVQWLCGITAEWAMFFCSHFAGFIVGKPSFELNVDLMLKNIGMWLNWIKAMCIHLPLNWIRSYPVVLIQEFGGITVIAIIKLENNGMLKPNQKPDVVNKPLNEIINLRTSLTQNTIARSRCIIALSCLDSTKYMSIHFTLPNCSWLFSGFTILTKGTNLTISLCTIVNRCI